MDTVGRTFFQTTVLSFSGTDQLSMEVDNESEVPYDQFSLDSNDGSVSSEGVQIQVFNTTRNWRSSAALVEAPEDFFSSRNPLTRFYRRLIGHFRRDSLAAQMSQPFGVERVEGVEETEDVEEVEEVGIRSHRRSFFHRRGHQRNQQNQISEAVVEVGRLHASLRESISDAREIRERVREGVPAGFTGPVEAEEEETREEEVVEEEAVERELEDEIEEEEALLSELTEESLSRRRPPLGQHSLLELFDHSLRPPVRVHEDPPREVEEDEEYVERRYGATEFIEHEHINSASSPRSSSHWRSEFTEEFGTGGGSGANSDNSGNNNGFSGYNGDSGDNGDDDNNNNDNSDNRAPRMSARNWLRSRSRSSARRLGEYFTRRSYSRDPETAKNHDASLQRVEDLDFMLGDDESKKKDVRV